MLQETAITLTKKFQVRAVRKTVKVMMKRVTRVKKKVDWKQRFRKRASNANKSSSDKEEMSEKKDIQV